MYQFKIMTDDAGRTVLKFLEKMLSDVPKSRLEKLFRQKDVKLNNKRINAKGIILQANDELTVYGVEFTTNLVKHYPLQKRFEVVYEDKHILVVNKAAGVVMHDRVDSLDQQIYNYLKFKQTNSFAPAAIGRLDKVTSGLVIYAKDYLTLRELKAKTAQFEKIYLFRSDLPQAQTTNFKIAHDELRKREVVSPQGKASKTVFYFENNRKFAQIFTGRKHQIRVSLAKLGYPIYGDRKYGGKKAERVFLHCYMLKLQNLSPRLEKLNGLTLMQEPKW